jgi:vancomycin resistance protein YoaR
MQGTYYPRTTVRLRRTVLDYVALLALLTLFFVVMLAAAWQFWHTNRIYTGVTVGGVPVGGLTRAEAGKRLHEQLYAYPLPPVSVAYAGQQWPLPMLQVQARADLADAVNRAYLVGREGAVSAQILERMRTALAGATITPPLSIDPAPLRAALEQVADRVEKPGVPARQIGAVAVPPQDGVQVDVDATLQAVLDALDRTDLHATAVVPLAAVNVAPQAVEPAATSAAGALSSVLFQQPLLLRSAQGGPTMALDPAVLAGFVVATDPLQLDAAKIRDHLSTLAGPFEVPPRDARLRFNPATGGLVVLQESRAGRTLDVEATAQAVEGALLAGAGEAPLSFAEVAPAVDSNRIAEMGIRELVASSSTYFAGSSASRVRNIEVAAEKFDGVVIPPNRNFSFNEIVRDVSSANGFEDSLIIWGDRTAVGVGGGVCQVSTTIFRTAYEGGFPIVARANHGYVVDWYGEPGLDATIFTPTVDFIFRNDTGSHLLLEPVVDSANGVITFNFYGTRPDRVVTVGKPVITDVKAPEPPSYVVDESLAAGEKEQVDWEKEGMTATVTRTIVESGTTRTDTLVSKYQPWRAVYLVGPGTEIPATPTPTVEVTGTP